MYDIVVVAVLEGQQKVADGLLSFPFCVVLLLNYPIEQLSPSHELHHEIHIVRTIINLSESNNVRVLHSLHDSDLCRQSQFVLGQQRGSLNYFDCPRRVISLASRHLNLQQKIPNEKINVRGLECTQGRHITVAKEPVPRVLPNL